MIANGHGNAPVRNALLMQRSNLLHWYNTYRIGRNGLLPCRNFINSDSRNEVPITLVHRRRIDDLDDYLLDCQSRQIAKSYVDNTINTILESSTTNNNNVLSAFDFTNYVDNCESDGLIENQGILMAIESHGLQQHNNVITHVIEIREGTLEHHLDGDSQDSYDDDDDDDDYVSTEMRGTAVQQNHVFSDSTQVPSRNNWELNIIENAINVAIKTKGLMCSEI